MTLLYRDYKKMCRIKTKILSAKIIHPTICMMEFLDQTREQPIDARLMICKEINEEAIKENAENLLGAIDLDELLTVGTAS